VGRLLRFLDRHLRLLSWSAVAGLLAVTVTGATVRLTASGLGCRSWPGCEGRIQLPQSGYHSYVEFGNRVVSSVPVALTVLLAIAAWRRTDLPRWARWAAIGAAVATVGQAPLGLLTVYTHLHPLMVMTHFLFTLVAIAFAVVVAVEVAGLLGGRAAAFDRRLRYSGLALVALLGALVVSGALATASGPHPGDYSEEVRRIWSLDDAAWLHVRVTAVFGIALILFVAALVARWRTHQRLALYALAALIVVVIQAGIGELQWRTGLPWRTVLAHVGVAGFAWAAVVALVALVWRPTRAVAEPARKLGK
jgi:cytochrome c oxidase assembly protein subunit 15